MAFKDTLQVSAAPVFLRLLLGFVMLWSGVGKLFTTEHVSPEDAAILAGMGVVGGTAGSGSRSSNPVRFDSPAANPELGPDQAAPLLMVLSDGPPPPLVARAATASDFSSGTQVASVYTTALLIHKASQPERGIRLWPPKIDTQPWPVIFAWAVAFIQTIGGASVLTGTFTRFFSFMIGLVILGSIWLTQIGPAIQSENALLGFLPIHGTFDFAAWMPLGSLVALLAVSASLVCSGSGGMSVDRMVGGGTSKPASKPKGD
jgi:hypothetical protein